MWEYKVPTEMGFYWYRCCHAHAAKVVFNAGREFSFCGTDEVMSPDEASTGLFWSEKLEAPK